MADRTDLTREEWDRALPTIRKAFRAGASHVYAPQYAIGLHDAAGCQQFEKDHEPKPPPKLRELPMPGCECIVLVRWNPARWWWETNDGRDDQGRWFPMERHLLYVGEMIAERISVLADLRARPWEGE